MLLLYFFYLSVFPCVNSYVTLNFISLWMFSGGKEVVAGRIKYLSYGEVIQEVTILFLYFFSFKCTRFFCCDIVNPPCWSPCLWPFFLHFIVYYNSFIAPQRDLFVQYRMKRLLGDKKKRECRTRFTNCSMRN